METRKQSVERKQAIEEQKFLNYANLKQINKLYLTPLECPYDAQMKSGDTYCLCEVKVRQDKDMAFFEKFGPFLELKKIEGLWKEKDRIKKEKGIDMQMLYFNFASDGLQIFYLNEPWSYKFDWRLLPKDNYEPHILVWKMVHSLKTPQEIIK